MRKKFYKQAKKGICIAALSATVLTSIPFVSYTDAYAKGQTTLEEIKALSMPTENVITYDLSDASLITDKSIVDCYGEEVSAKVIEINITENGNYIIKGSNEINGALIDTHIAVAEGVEANIIFDGAVIHNDEIYRCDMETSADTYAQLFPILDIAGKANVYVMEDTSLMGEQPESPRNLSSVIQVTGDLTIKESNARLQLKNAKYAIVGQSDGVRKRGNVTIEGGNLETTGNITGLNRFTMSGGTFTSAGLLTMKDFVVTGGIWDASIAGDAGEWYGEVVMCEAEYNVHISGGTIRVNRTDTSPDYTVKIFSGNDVRVSGGVIEVQQGRLELGTVYDAYGNAVNLFEITGLPENAEVAKINGLPVKDVQTTAEGALHTPLAYSSNLIELADGTIYKYDYSRDTETGEEQMRKEEPDENTSISTHQVTLQFPENESGEVVTVADGFEIQNTYFDGEDRYEYYNTADVKYDGLTIQKDEELVLKKKQLAVTLEGKPFTGTVLPDGNMYYRKTSPTRYFVAYPGDPIREDAEYKILPTEKRGEKWFVKIQSMEDIALITNILNRDKTINILLETDLDFEGETRQKSLLNSVKYYATSQKYYGTFDGNGHVISNVTIGQDNWQPYFLANQNYGTIKNVHFKNVTVEQCDWNDTRSGIICGSNYGVIENCSLEGAAIHTVAKRVDSQGQLLRCDKRREWGTLAGGNYGTIRGSYVRDITFSGPGESYPITHEFSYSKLENTYYEAEVETGEIGAAGETAKTAAQFASGEICSLLNQDVTDGSQYWYQNIDNGEKRDSVPVTDSSHGTVYSGYEGCARVYSNTKIFQMKPSHNINYTAEDNVLTGVCENDPLHTITVTLTAEDAVEDGTEHTAVLDTVYSKRWGDAPQTYDIVYTRDGKVTTDLKSPGTITASVTAGGAVAEVTYTIKEAPTPTPTAIPTPTGTPAATKQPTAPTVTPAVTKQPTAPTATPVVTKKPTTPTAKPTGKPSAAPTAKPTVKPTAVPTAKPTVKPTVAPTAKPTVKPTVAPTVKPTVKPTVAPTVKPTVKPTAVPTAKPTEAPAVKPSDKPASPGASEKPGSAASPSKAPAVIAPGETKAPAATKAPEAEGTKIKSKKGDTYKVTNTSGKTAEVKLTKIAKNSKAKTVVIPKTVKVDGVNYKVTSIAKKAFAGNKNLKTVVIGAEIEKIGAKAFYNCSNLKVITIKSTSLTTKTVGAKAFAKIHKKAVVKVPKLKKAAYKKWLKKRGIGGKQKIMGK